MAKKKKIEETKVTETEQTKNTEKQEVVSVSEKLKRCKAYRARMVVRKRK